MRLPDEVLAEIIGYLALNDPDWFSVEYIKSCRLTCRRLSCIASTFLIPCIGVDISLSSLFCLEAISQHPLISRSVKAVDMNLTLYKCHISSAFTTFVGYCLKLLERDLGSKDTGSLDEIDWEWWEIDEPTAKGIFDNIKNIQQRWSQIRRDIIHGNEENAFPDLHQNFLIAQYKEYQRFHGEQTRPSRQWLPPESCRRDIQAAFCKISPICRRQYRPRHWPVDSIPF